MITLTIWWIACGSVVFNKIRRETDQILRNIVWWCCSFNVKRTSRNIRTRIPFAGRPDAWSNGIDGPVSSLPPNFNADLVFQAVEISHYECEQKLDMLCLMCLCRPFAQMHNISGETGATGKHSLRFFVGGFSGSECICPSTTVAVCERCMKNHSLILCPQQVWSWKKCLN